RHALPLQSVDGEALVRLGTEIRAEVLVPCRKQPPGVERYLDEESADEQPVVGTCATVHVVKKRHEVTGRACRYLVVEKTVLQLRGALGEALRNLGPPAQQPGAIDLLAGCSDNGYRRAEQDGRHDRIGQTRAQRIADEADIDEQGDNGQRRDPGGGLSPPGTRPARG